MREVGQHSTLASCLVYLGSQSVEHLTLMLREITVLVFEGICFLLDLFGQSVASISH